MIRRALLSTTTHHRSLAFQARSPHFERRVRESFAQQSAMSTLGAALQRVEPGRVSIALERRDNLTQQHGFVHGGVLAAVMDSCCGYAAFTLFDEQDSVLSVNFNVNLLAPAEGSRFDIEANVVKSGRTLNVVEARAMRVADQKLVATMTATIMVIKHLSEPIAAKSAKK
jgi:uncharacterized protein (TIGR00369 family)